MLEQLLEPIKTDSLKDVFVIRFEELILSGKVKIGQKLPSERELALQLGVSRPVVHEGLVELASAAWSRSNRALAPLSMTTEKRDQ